MILMQRSVALKRLQFWIKSSSFFGSPNLPSTSSKMGSRHLPTRWATCSELPHGDLKPSLPLASAIRRPAACLSQLTDADDFERARLGFREHAFSWPSHWKRAYALFPVASSSIAQSTYLRWGKPAPD